MKKRKISLVRGVSHIYHGNSHRMWYEYYYTSGAYLAKFWLTYGKEYARTPKQVVKWILEGYYKTKIKNI